MKRKATLPESARRSLPRKGFSDEQRVKWYRFGRDSLYFTERVIENNVRSIDLRHDETMLSQFNLRATCDYTKIFCLQPPNPSAKLANVSNFFPPSQLAKPNPAAENIVASSLV